MSNIDETGDIRVFRTPESMRSGQTRSVESRLLTAVLIAFFAVFIFFLIKSQFYSTDYVGRDNDDAMRLVEVRDFLAGQGWFDMMQYRLGPAPGTLMHWSRFVDLPIALLISFFHMFTAEKTAEAIALFIWPVSLAFPLIYFTGLGAWRLGGEKAIYPAVAIAAIFALSIHRFEPGGIDHHNVQMVLVAMVAAALADPDHGVGSYMLAGFAGAFALAVGVETTPLMAVAAMAIALRWAFVGQAYAGAAKAFGLTFGLLTSAAFFATVPSQFYLKVTCDSLSFGYFSLAAFGGIALFTIASVFSGSSLVRRLTALGVLGVAAAVLAVVVMPQCLQDPLNNLDPLLRKIWLDNIQEAQPFWRQAQIAPQSIGGFYIPGFLALVVSLWRVRMRNNKAGVYAAFFALLAISWGISIVQVRGSMFAGLLAILPLSALIAELHGYSRKRPDSVAAGLPFAVVTLAAIPAFWFTVGALASLPFGPSPAERWAKEAASISKCFSRESLEALNALPKGMIAAPSNMGTPILRFTDHSVLAAPYHRNQAGLLAVIHAGLAKPSDAEAILGDAGTDYFVYCPGDPEIAQLARRAPGGFFAELAKGKVPYFLNEVPLPAAKGLRVFEMVR